MSLLRKWIAAWNSGFISAYYVFILCLFMFLILILLNNFHCSKCDHKAYNKAEFKVLFIYNYLLSRGWMLLVMCCENPLACCCISPATRENGAISQTQPMDLLKENVKAWLLKWNSLGQVWVTSNILFGGDCQEQRSQSFTPLYRQLRVTMGCRRVRLSLLPGVCPHRNSIYNKD